MEMLKMPNSHRVVILILILQVCTNAAPSDLIEKLKSIANVESDASSDGEPSSSKEGVTNGNSTVRQKRQFYNYYGFPPYNPSVYPSYPRDDYNSFGGDDHFSQIYRRLQDIASVVRQQNVPPPPPPPPAHFPFYLPVFYIPQAGCACNPNQYVPPVPDRPVTPRPNQNDSNVDISNRFPDMEDDRQNWGFVVNDTEPDDGLEEDFTRPISFDPIQPNRTMTRPPPEVEHGSNQAGEASQTTTTTMRPVENAPAEPPSSSLNPPTTCDTAILSCCHQPEVTYDCFAIQGCSDPSSYGNPCDTQVILRVIDRFQRFYGQRRG